MTINPSNKAVPKPKDAHVLEAMLREAGFNLNFNSNVINQLLEIAHRMSVEILEIARDFTLYARRKAIEYEDVQVATDIVNGKIPPHHELPPTVIRRIAKSINSRPLPDINQAPQNGFYFPNEDSYLAELIPLKTCKEEKDTPFEETMITDPPTPDND